MATTYTAVASGGNWNSASTWNVGTGYPVAGDTAILNSTLTGTVTLTASAACAVLDMTDNGGTLALGNYNITCTADVTIDGTITAGTGYVVLSGTATKNLTTNGVTIPRLRVGGGTQTVNLMDDLNATYIDLMGNYGSPTFYGNFDITADTLYFGYVNMANAVTLTIPSGQTLTVNSKLYVLSNPALKSTIKSGTTSSEAFLHYNGTAGNCLTCAMNITDISFPHSIDNWMGGTLTRCNNAEFTVSSANATAGATYTNNGQTFTVDATITGGTTLKTTMQTSLRPAASGTLTKASGTGDSTITFSAVTIQGIINQTSADFATTSNAANILSGTTISGIAGTFDESARNTDPGEANVKSGTTYKIQNVSKEGTYSAGGGVYMPRPHAIGV